MMAGEPLRRPLNESLCATASPMLGQADTRCSRKEFPIRYAAEPRFCVRLNPSLTVTAQLPLPVASELRVRVWPPASLKNFAASPSCMAGWQEGVQE